MIVILGIIIVLGSVLTGFSMAGGHMHALIHPSEFVTIGGAAFGALVIMSPGKVLKDLLKGVIGLLKGSPFNKPMAIELIGLIFALTKMIRRDGLLALDGHIYEPSKSDLFKQFPKVANNHHLCHFICDALAMIVDGKAETAQLTAALEEEVDVIDREHHAATGALAKTADALPGFGIVAAVLGIVVTMASIGGPVEEIGHKVGAALVGTFLGILLAYGFFAPMAGRMEAMGHQETIFLRAICAAVIEMREGGSPRDVVTRTRRTLGTDCRPTQGELKKILGES